MLSDISLKWKNVVLSWGWFFSFLFVAQLLAYRLVYPLLTFAILGESQSLSQGSEWIGSGIRWFSLGTGLFLVYFFFNRGARKFSKGQGLFEWWLTSTQQLLIKTK